MAEWSRAWMKNLMCTIASGSNQIRHKNHFENETNAWYDRLITQRVI